jgi:hypothetical protein
MRRNRLLTEQRGGFSLRCSDFENGTLTFLARLASKQILMPLPLLVSRDKILNLIDAVPIENPVAVPLP